jgi:hypothetical protein
VEALLSKSGASSGIHTQPLILFIEGAVVVLIRHFDARFFSNLAPGTRLLWIPPVPDDRRAPVFLYLSLVLPADKPGFCHPAFCRRCGRVGGAHEYWCTPRAKPSETAP